MVIFTNINQSKPVRMKKKIVVIRFGSPTPTKGDVLAIIDKLGMDASNGELLGCPLLFGMASILFTDKSPSEVRQAFADAEQEIEDELPVIVLDEEGMKGVSLTTMGFEPFADMNRVFDQEFGTGPKDGKSCTMSLDELLDLVSQVGVNGLDEAQFTRLRELTKEA